MPTDLALESGGTGDHVQEIAADSMSRSKQEVFLSCILPNALRHN